MARAGELADGHKVVNELLRSQIETNSRVCASVAEIERSLKETRRCAIDAARAHGARVIASSTHPWARWQEQKVTQKERYQRAEIDLQDSVRQFFIGGMHIHAGFGDDDRRIEVMHALRGYLAVFLVLSCSSPFQGGRLKERYQRAEIDLQDSVRQFFIGGMHIHAGFGDDDRRIEVMHALRGYLAVFLVLSCSSPFQGGRWNGVQS